VNTTNTLSRCLNSHLLILFFMLFFQHLSPFFLVPLFLQYTTTTFMIGNSTSFLTDWANTIIACIHHWLKASINILRITLTSDSVPIKPTGFLVLSVTKDAILSISAVINLSPLIRRLRR